MRRTKRRPVRVTTTILIAATLWLQASQQTKTVEWPQYGGEAGGSRYSQAAAINTGNVAGLKAAWTFRTGDMSDGKSGMRGSKFEATPVLFRGTLFLTTPFNRVIALDPSTGKQVWTFDPKIDLKVRYSESLVSRGVSS